MSSNIFILTGGYPVYVFMNRRRRQAYKALVLIASPDKTLRTRFADVLKQTHKVFQSGNEQKMEEMIGKFKPAVLFLDLALQLGHSKVGQTMLRIRRLSSSTKIIVLTVNTDRHKRMLTLLKAGAIGYCSHHIDSILLRRAVEMVQKGEMWVHRSLISYVLKQVIGHRSENRKMQTHLSSLTLRQREVAEMISNGISNKIIASDLNISESAVKKHVSTIFRKVGVSDRLTLALRLRDNTPLLQQEGPAELRLCLESAS